MKAVRLHGPRDLRYEDIPNPSAPDEREVFIKVASVGICGSDLHNFNTGRSSVDALTRPLILGHEFSAVVAEVGPNAVDGQHQPLHAGQRVAIDPALPCWYCDQCEAGNPNLCRRLGFMGLEPDDGGLQECMTLRARNCFPIPDSLSMDAAALLEPLGVALHSADLAKLRIGQSVAVLGCGPIGLLIIQLMKLAGASRIIAIDQFGWRLAAAKQCGADVCINFKAVNPIEAVYQHNEGRGTEAVFEAAWADDSVAQAIEMADHGGKMILVGISEDDRVEFGHAAARRKGLTIKVSRRMKNVYPRAIALAASGKVNLDMLVSHRVPLAETADAFRMNVSYADNVIKIVVDVGGD